jgi:4-hydroxy-tetrahydrodipicolinate synthase
MKQLYGTGVALVTPFKTDLSVDEKALRDIVEHCLEGGIDYLVVLGTTGEPVTLGKSEKQKVIRTVVHQNAGRLPLVIGMGGNNTMQLAEEIRNADLSPFDAILSVSPYYNRPTQEGIYQHYKIISEAAAIPVIAYNVPARTGSNILPDTVLRLAAACDNLVGIKEASGDMAQVETIIRNKPPDFLVVSGDDGTALPTVLAGGAGVISVLGQGVPSEYTKMIRLATEGAEYEARKLEALLKPAMELIFAEGNPAGIKAVFEILGLATAAVRLPLVEASPALKMQIRSYMKTLAEVHA